MCVCKRQRKEKNMFNITVKDQRKQKPLLQRVMLALPTTKYFVAFEKKPERKHHSSITHGKWTLDGDCALGQDIIWEMDTGEGSRSPDHSPWGKSLSLES